jgi:predicted nucleic acid-binding protein
MPVWDTSVASRLGPEGSHIEVATAAALAQEPIKLAAPTVAEISYGLQRRAGEPSFANAMRWFAEILRAEMVEVLPVTREVALLAGRLRALHPVAPSSRRGDGRSKPERRVAWVTDIQIAACAWLNGEPVCTADLAHFTVLGDGIARLYPDEGPLELLSAP